MGLLAERWEATRSAADWLHDDDTMTEGPRTVAGTRVNRTTALGLSTVFRCWDLLSSAVSQAPRDVIVKVGGQSFPEFNPPSWLTSPNPSDPTYTGDAYFSQVALSILSAGEYFTRVWPYVLDPVALVVIDPGLVDVRPGPLYDIRNDRGQIVETVGPMEMLHGTWMRLPGALRGLSPLEYLRVSFGTALATQDHAARFFGQGASLSFGVEVPGPLDKTKKEEMAETLRRKYAGLSNSHAIGVLTNGAKFITGLAPTPEQAQFLDTRKFGVEEVCRIYGVPPSLASSQEPGASSYASAEVYDKQFAERAVLPLAIRIEKQHERLLTLPANLAPSSSIQFKFNLDGVARVNILSRYQAYAAGVQGGFLKPREARNHEDLPPLKDGSDDQLFMQQQMTPIDKLGKTAAETPPTLEAVA